MKPKTIVRAAFFVAALGFCQVSFGQGRPRQVKGAAFFNPRDRTSHGVGVEGGATYTSSASIRIRDPNSPGSTSTVTLSLPSREVVEHIDPAPGGVNLTGWKLFGAWEGREKKD